MNEQDHKHPENQPSKKGGWFLWNGISRTPSKGAKIALDVMIFLLIAGLITFLVLAALGYLSK